MSLYNSRPHLPITPCFGVDSPDYSRSSAIISLSCVAEDTAYVNRPSSSAQASTSSFEPLVSLAATNNVDEDDDFL